MHLHDAPSARLGRAGEAGRRQFLRDMEDTVDLLYNCVCLGLWVPFNEGWGQFDALAVTDRLRALDPTRPIDHASGWHDQGGKAAMCTTAPCACGGTDGGCWP